MAAACSICICTRNPRPDFLRRVIEALQAQTLAREHWDLILVDNASQEPLAKTWDLSWHPRARHVREEEVGLMPARLRAIREFKSDLILFLDDDNVLQPDYLAVVLELAAAHPRLGCYGAGVLAPEFECPPAPELAPYLASLALRTFQEPQWSNRMADYIVPYGAGLAVRRVVAERMAATVSHSPLRQLLGRKGVGLNSGEDDEISWVACELGYGKGVFPALRITHLIDRRRVEKSYLLALVRGHAFSHTILARIHGVPHYLPSPPSTLADVFKNCLRADLTAGFQHARYWWRHRHSSALDRAFAAARHAGVQQALALLKEMDLAAVV